MKRILTFSLLCTAALMLTSAGCKKSQPKPGPAEPAAEKMSMPETVQPAESAVKEIQKPAVEDIKKTVVQTTENMSGPIETLKTQAAGMDLAPLQAIAGKYKTEILAKQDQLMSLKDKLAAIPAAGKLGTEATAITSEITQLMENLNSLRARFDVYVNAIRGKGGDISALGL